MVVQPSWYGLVAPEVVLRTSFAMALHRCEFRVGNLGVVWRRNYPKGGG
jgi:hypothetical protein